MASESHAHLALLPVDPELANWFMEDVGVELEGDRMVAGFGDERLVLRTLDGNEEPDEETDEETDAEILVGLIRFVDVLSLQKMEELLRKTPRGASVPTALLVYRNENEVDFKMSCPYCGQKLWVRDADKDKRGRCPHCHKGFTLPEQEEHVASVLRLKDSVPVYRVVRNDPASLSAPLRSIVQLKNQGGALKGGDGESAFESNQTMNVDVEEEG